MPRKTVVSQAQATLEQLQYFYKNEFTPEKNLGKPKQETTLQMSRI